MLDAREPVAELLPHLVDVARRGRNTVFLAKPARGVVWNDAPDLVEYELDALVERVAVALHGDELAGLELLGGRLDVLEYLGRNFTRDVLEQQGEKWTAAADTTLLAGAQKKPGARRGGDELSDARQASHSGPRTSAQCTARW